MRTFTYAGLPGVEARVEAALAACISSLKDAAGESWVGAALGGALGLGEGGTLFDEARVLTFGDPLELFAVVEAPAARRSAWEKTLEKALAATARPRGVAASVTLLPRAALGHLPPTLSLLELLAADRVVDGSPNLLAPAEVSGAARAGEVDLVEGLRLLVRRGAALLAAERALDRRGAGRAEAHRALYAVRDVDLALGAAVLLAAGLWAPGEAARVAALARLAAGEVEAPRDGFHRRMSWTRFRDLVDRQRAALKARGAFDVEVLPADARREVAHAADRWMEVLRLLEEERLAEPLPTWTAYARSLAARQDAASRPLFDGLFDESEDALPSRRAARAWTPAERLAPALGALLDWNPGDRPLAPRLLDVPDDAPREKVSQRALALAATA